MDDFLEGLSAIDLTLPPPEVLAEFQALVKRQFSPQWLALLHRDPLDGDHHVEPTFTTPSLFSLLSKESPGRSIGEGGRRIPKPLEGRVSEIAPALATILGQEPQNIARFLEEKGTFAIYGVPIVQNGRFFGYFAMGSERELDPPQRTLLKTLTALLGHFYRVCEEVAYQRTKSVAFRAMRLPSLITDNTGRILEVNDALLEFFGYSGAPEITPAPLDELFIFHTKETLPQLLRKQYLARPVVAAPLGGEKQATGVLHSVAGEQLPQGLRLRYFYFLPDAPGFSADGEGEAKHLHYPRLELPQELSLTAREIDVAIRIAAGESSKEIARRLNVSIRTVQFHRQSLRDKLGIVGRGLSLRHALLRYEEPRSQND